MPQASLQCHSCGTRLDVELNEVELQKLRAQGKITRFCRVCAGNTQWVARSSSSFTRLSREEEEAAPSTAPTVTGAGAPMGAKRVLLIDDDEGVLAVLSKVLRSMELEIDVASSGREAARKLGREDYDLILSDIRMPELDGKQLFEFLDQNFPEYKERVIFLTGDTGNPETMEFLQQTNCPYLTKPVEIPVFLSLLHHFFAGESGG